MRTAQDIDVLTNERTAAVAKRPLRVALAVAAVVAIADQLTKAWAEARLVAAPCTDGGDECIDLFLGLRFHLVYNPGAAFSTGGELGALFAVVAFVMTIVLLNVARKRVDRLGPILLGLIAGGAVGNLIDRVVRAEDGLLSGEVIDFIDLQWWPVFNLADSAVVTGVIVFVLYSFFEPADERADADPEHTPDDPTTSDDSHDSEATSTLDDSKTPDDSNTGD